MVYKMVLSEGIKSDLAFAVDFTSLKGASAQVRESGSNPRQILQDLERIIRDGGTDGLEVQLTEIARRLRRELQEA